MNFVSDYLEKADPSAIALIEIDQHSNRREWTFKQVIDGSADFGWVLQKHGIRRGDVVMTLIGNRREWVLTMVACFRIGAVVLPCTEQLTSEDLAFRISEAGVKLIVADQRNLPVVDEAVDKLADSQRPALIVCPDDQLFAGAQHSDKAELAPTDGCLITFTSGTTGKPKAVLHGQKYLAGQQLQASSWLDARQGDIVWCTAASGWSKSARNVFIAPWVNGASAVICDQRFTPEQRLKIIGQELVTVLCMAPTEYRLIAASGLLNQASATRSLASVRSMVAAGEALGQPVIDAFAQFSQGPIRDGYGQTETGQITGVLPGQQAPHGSMGCPLPGIRIALSSEGELLLDPATVPTFSVGYVKSGEVVPHNQSDLDSLWHTGDLVTQNDQGFITFVGRNDDVIVSSGYRIGPFEVESALHSHSAVAESAAVAKADLERGWIVKAFVVLKQGFQASPRLTKELQDHVKTTTAPYKYPREIEFVEQLPKTASGKVKRNELREQ